MGSTYIPFEHVRVGNTPLLSLSSISPKNAQHIKVWMKYETTNETGSIKDRIAKGMIEKVDAQNRSGTIKTIVEASSGNTACAVALYSKLYGFDCVLFVQHKISNEKLEKAKFYGAEVIKVEDGVDYMKVAAEYTQRLGNQAVYLDQYNNPTNSEIHYKETGPEIIENMEGRQIHEFISTASTGGTISGIGKALKEHDERVVVTLVDPEYSLLSEHFERHSIDKDNIDSANELLYSGESIIEGAGKKSVPANMNFNVIDRVATVYDWQALWAYEMLKRNENNLRVGGSTSLNVYEALRIAKIRAQHSSSEDYNIVLMGADGGENYVSKFEDNSWKYNAMVKSLNSCL